MTDLEQLMHHGEIKLLKEILDELKEINYFLHHPKQAAGVAFIFTNEKGEKLMADFVLAQGAKVNVSLHYVDSAGNDLGQVPPTDTPTITGDNPALVLTPVGDGSDTGTNGNTTNADINVNLAGAAKGFTTTAVVTVSAAGVTPPVPAGVKFIFA
jgi:hypothetical protein